MNFNPLPRKEGDEKEVHCYKLFCSISIHSLVKRETTALLEPDAAELNFNPLPRKEGDRKERSYKTGVVHFNPLPRKEGDDRLPEADGETREHFNPLPRKEGDTENPIQRLHDIISIHSLVKRETHFWQVTNPSVAISIHSLVKRETWFGICLV